MYSRGPRSMGGLGVMSWTEHIKAIKARQWIVRYLQPGDSAWKNMLDEFILKSTQGGKLQYPEGRTIVVMGLTVAQKRAILKRMPTKAVYWKECLTVSGSILSRFDFVSHLFPAQRCDLVYVGVRDV